MLSTTTDYSAYYYTSYPTDNLATASASIESLVEVRCKLTSLQYMYWCMYMYSYRCAAS